MVYKNPNKNLTAYLDFVHYTLFQIPLGPKSHADLSRIPRRTSSAPFRPAIAVR